MGWWITKIGIFMIQLVISSPWTVLELPPRVTSPVSQEMVIVFPGLTSINCMATGHPTPTFTWFRNDIKLDESSPNIKSYTNGSLHIYNLNDDQAGYLQCRASNQLGVSVSVKFQILPEKKPNEKANQIDSSQTVTEGEPLEIRCQYDSVTRPVYEKRWYFRNGGKELILDNRVGTDQATGTLRFTYVTTEDAQTYTCSLIPKSSVNILNFYGNYTVRVNPSPTVDYRKPTDMYHTDSVLAHIGNNADLECYFSGRPAPTISWKDNKNNDIQGKSDKFEIVDNGHRLKIKKVSEDDEGTFRCTASNTAGSDTQYIQINVTSRPMLEKSLDTNISPETKTVTLSCSAKSARGELLDRPVWYRNGQLLTQDLQRYQFDEQRKSLTIKDLRKQDTACYQCNISNSEGYLFYDGYLKVIDSIKVKVRPPPEVIVETSPADIDVTVQATGDVCCEIKYDWFHNGIRRDYQTMISLPVFRDVNGVLMFNRGDLPKETLNTFLGTYTCVVSNDYDSVNVSFTLFLREEQPLIVAVASASLWWVWLLCGLLLVTIAVVLLIVLLKKRQFPRATYQLEKTELKHNLNPEEELSNPLFQEI